MTRDAALKALDTALEQRLIREFDVLADGFMGSANACETAKTNFTRGVGIHLDALTFAAGVIADKFKD